MSISLGSNTCRFSKSTWQVSLSTAHRAMAEIGREVLEGDHAKIESFSIRRQSFKDGVIGQVSFYGVKKFNYVCIDGRGRMFLKREISKEDTYGKIRKAPVTC